MMRGLKVVALFLGLAWLLAGGAALWARLDAGGQRAAERAGALEEIAARAREATEELQGELDKVRADAETELEAAREKLAEGQSTLDEAGAEPKKRVAQAEAELEEAQGSGPPKRVTRAEGALKVAKRQLEGALAAPTRRRDAAQQVVDKLEKRRDERLAKLQAQVEEIDKRRAEQVQRLEDRALVPEPDQLRGGGERRHRLARAAAALGDGEEVHGGLRNARRAPARHHPRTGRRAAAGMLPDALQKRVNGEGRMRRLPRPFQFYFGDAGAGLRKRQ